MDSSKLRQIIKEEIAFELNEREREPNKLDPEEEELVAEEIDAAIEVYKEGFKKLLAKTIGGMSMKLKVDVSDKVYREVTHSRVQEMFEQEIWDLFTDAVRDKHR